MKVIPVIILFAAFMLSCKEKNIESITEPQCIPDNDAVGKLDETLTLSLKIMEEINTVHDYQNRSVLCMVKHEYDSAEIFLDSAGIHLGIAESLKKKLDNYAK